VSAPRVYAHRGGMGESVASSREAFARAGALAGVGFELDIHPTSDGALVVFHDDRLDPATNMAGPVHDLTLVELREQVDLSGGSAPGRVQMLTLEEVLALLGDRGCSIDIKEDLGEGSFIEPALAAVLEEHGVGEQVVVASFLDGPLARFRALGTGIATAASTAEAVGWYQDFLGRRHRERPFRVLSLPSRFMGQEYLGTELVDFAHEEGLEVWVWTINEDDELMKMAGFKVDAVVTDYPTRATALFGPA